MARYHSGGFIDSQFYFNIGTEDARGRDGDTARDAAKKYNDHRHSAYVAVSTNDLRNWKNELQEESTDPASGNPGGILTTDGHFLRLPGDLAELNAVLYMATSNSIRSISSGFGVHVDMDPQIPEIVEDYVASNFSMLRSSPPPEGVACLFADDGTGLRPFKHTIADCVVYPSMRAASGDIDTQVVVTAGVKVSNAPTIGNQGDPLPVPPVIGVLLTPKYYPTNTATQRIVSSQVTQMPGYLITSLTGDRFPGDISNSEDVGHTVAGVMTLPSNFEGRIELEMSFDVDACYTVDEYNAVAAMPEVNMSVENLKSAICEWASQNVKLDIIDATARVLCTFRGE
jgi:hypothetical protein